MDDRTNIRKLVMIFISLYALVMIIMTKSFHSFVYLTHSGLERELSLARFLTLKRMGDFLYDPIGMTMAAFCLFPFFFALFVWIVSMPSKKK